MKFYLDQIYAILSAMRDVATTQGKQPLSDMQTRSIKAIYKYVFHHQDELEIESLSNISFEQFPTFFTNIDSAEYALRFLIVTAMMDGELEQEKIISVFNYANAIGISPQYLLQLQKLLNNDIHWVIKDITLRNLESFDVYPHLESEEDIDRWLFPYRGEHHNPELVAKYENLHNLPKDSFGFGIWKQIKDNNTPFLVKKKASTTHLSCHMIPYMY